MSNQEKKEWTVIYYLAGDNSLAPSVVSQLKAIKDAGFHEKIDVLIYFDPNELGVPTRIYDVNRERKRNPKLPNTMIGDGADPFVRNLSEDDIEDDTENIKGEEGPASLAIRKALQQPDRINAEAALELFLNFCLEQHRAKRYIVILLGHGMIVGNDAFLPDDNPVSAITLKKLGDILKNFTSRVRNDQSTFELLGLHSCSLSGIEVTYELKGTANFMMASEGPAFVGSWPYRQMLKKTFNSLEEAKEKAQQKAKENGEDQVAAAANPDLDIPDLMESLYSLTLYNATDFLLAGYNLDLSLCSLSPAKYEALTGSIQKLVAMLKKALEAARRDDGSAAAERGKRIKELILLAHWEAQSYWGETYTDLFDFCRCLAARCAPTNDLEDLRTACSNVQRRLDTIKSKNTSERFKALVIRSENFGSKFQYSHGLSVYFPWSRPIENVGNGSGGARAAEDWERYAEEGKGVLERYADYQFTKELGDDSWLSFLNSYFDETKRRSREEEDGVPTEARQRKFSAANDSFNPFGPLSGILSNGKPSPLLEGKPSPIVGEGCSCSSIKNYPERLKIVQGKAKRNVEAFSITEGALDAFE